MGRMPVCLEWFNVRSYWLTSVIGTSSDRLKMTGNVGMEENVDISIVTRTGLRMCLITVRRTRMNVMAQMIP